MTNTKCLYLQKTHNLIKRHLSFKNPTKLIIYIDICHICNHHFDEYFNKLNDDNQKEIISTDKIIILNSKEHTKKTIIYTIQNFYNKINTKKKILIIKNDDTISPHDSCITTFNLLSKKIKINKKIKLKIEISNFCIYKNPYCYIKQINTIKQIIINEQILFFQPSKIIKNNKEEPSIQLQNHQNFVKNIITNYYQTNNLNLDIIHISNNIKNYQEYLIIINKILNSKFLVVYYEPQCFDKFLEIHNMSKLEITNKIHAQEIYDILKTI